MKINKKTKKTAECVIFRHIPPLMFDYCQMFQVSTPSSRTSPLL